LECERGARSLFEVDSNAVKAEKVRTLYDDVLRVLREARIPFTNRVIRGDSVEVRITRESDVPQALAKLRELAQPLGGLLSATGQRSVDVHQERGRGGGAVRRR